MEWQKLSLKIMALKLSLLLPSMTSQGSIPEQQYSSSLCKPQLYASYSLDKFLSIIRFLESSDGKNIKHRMILSGIHKGTAAIGDYGLMPNTIKLFGSMESDLYVVATKLADKLHKRCFSEDELLTYKCMASGWMYGHNLSKAKLHSKFNSFYVKRFEKQYIKLAVEDSSKVPAYPLKIASSY
jgi:hypothetical protein